nr:choice-of-anchor M domain-containing protein [Motilibacter aurantiacus]
MVSGTVAPGVLASPAAAAPAATATVALSKGHVDLGARIIRGKLQMLVKDGTVAGRVTWREPAKTRYVVLGAAKTTVPSAKSYRFLGTAGAPLWMLPQTQRSDLLWPGWNTEEIKSNVVRGSVTWSLRGVRGPGAFALFTTGAFGAPQVLFDSDDTRADRVAIPLGTHAHGNWAFSKRGTYRLTFTMSARLVNGKNVSDTEVLTVQVQ